MAERMDNDAGILWFVLDESSRQRLREAVPAMHQNLFYHHVTLKYGVGREEVAHFINKTWTVNVYAVAYNDQAQACRVETGGLPDMYGVPHITLSTAEHVKPYASVAMLQGEHQETPLGPITLEGTIEFSYLQDVKD